MKRFLLILALSVSTVACLDSDDDDKPAASSPKSDPIATKSELDPTGDILEKPPANGALPEDLKPPV